jgi:hypothetical protein
MERQDIHGSGDPQANRDRALGNKYAKRSAIIAAQTAAAQKPSLPPSNAGKIACYPNSRSTGLVVLQQPEVGQKVHWLLATASIEAGQNHYHDGTKTTSRWLYTLSDFAVSSWRGFRLEAATS